MPTQNRQQLVIRAIKSILRQDCGSQETIVADDCSTSQKRPQQYVTALSDPRIIYIRNDIGSGTYVVCNQAIMLMQGRYVARIDDDDEWIPNHPSIFLAHKQ